MKVGVLASSPCSRVPFADGVDEKEGVLTHTMTLVEELAVRNSSLCRYVAVMIRPGVGMTGK